MAISLPNIKIGISTKKAYFDKTHDVSTTSDFGFVQPTLFDDVIPNTNIKLRTHSKIMLAPMPQQTFSRIQMHTTNVFVPMSDVYLAFDNQQTQTTVQSAYKSYIPTSADSITVKNLFYSLFFAPTLHLANTFSTDHIEPLAFTKVWEGDSNGIVPVSNVTATYQTSLTNLLTSLQFGTPHTYHSTKTFATDLTSLVKYFSSYNYFLSPDYVTPSWDNADFKIESNTLVNNKHIYVTLHLSHRGQRVMKVLNGLGYKFGLFGKPVSILPLLAYYKAWFDKYNPPRNTQWKATKCFYLIHSYYDLAENIDNSSKSSSANTERRYLTFLDFLQQLSDCCYTLPIDPFTACLTNPLEGNQISQTSTIPVNDVDSYSVHVERDSLPYNDSSDNSIMVKAILKLLPMVNKYSVIGARVEQWLKVKYGISLPRNYVFGENKVSCFVEEILSSTNYQSEDKRIGNYLGERGGVSSNKNSSNETHFTADTFGFVLQLMCIVPFGGYSQGINPSVCRVNREDFYDNTYDSLGMEACPSSEFMCENNLIDSTHINDSDSTFGFRPRHFNYKYKTNLRNGCFANGQKDSFLGYQLDRYFTVNDILGDGTYVGNQPTDWQTTEELRFIGVSEDYGNYDRMFYDVKGTTDNFIIQMIQEYSITSPMLPISESYDTFDQDGLSDDNATTSISHS